MVAGSKVMRAVAQSSSLCIEKHQSSGVEPPCHVNHNHHHHQITKLSHSINAIGPAPHRSGRKREHRSIVFATIT
jgi:hypothetical protein